MALSKKAASEFLQRAHDRKRLAHAYLLTGESGSGKRDVAFDLAALATGTSRENIRLGLNPDVHIAEPESKSRRIVIDQVRHLEKGLQLCSLHGRRKVAIIVDADRLNLQASNAFLKTLEEPPDNSLLLLLTSLPETLPETILSRCISVRLQAPTGANSSAVEEQLGQALKDFFAHESRSLASVFGLVRTFQRLLSGVRERIHAESGADWKRDEALYKQSTDGEWLKDREDHYKAVMEAQYLQQRTRLVEMLLQWWADVLRLQHGSARLDYPSHEVTTRALAQKLTVRDVLRRAADLEDLRDQLGRNVQEALALEAAFLKVFTT